MNRNANATWNLPNNRLESDVLPFRCAPGQAATQADRYTLESLR